MMLLFPITTIIASFHKSWRPLVALFAYGLALLASGCATSKPQQAKKEKPTHERGWIGGEYQFERSFPKSFTTHPKTALLVVAAGTNTPVYAAGLHAGDLVLQLNHEPIKRLQDFYGMIDDCKPGTLIALSAWRDGQTLEFNVPVGRETFQHGGTITLYLFPPWEPPSPFWPRGHSGFSLIATGLEFTPDNRAEFGSVKKTYHLKCDPNFQPHNTDWRFWLALLQLTKDKNILKQEKVETQIVPR